MMAAFLRDALIDCGLQRVDIASGFDEGFRAMERAVYGLALIDVDPRIEWQWRVADALSAQGIAIIFLTSGVSVPHGRYLRSRIMLKPFRQFELQSLLSQFSAGDESASQ